jgi:ribosomal protein L7/L12
MEKITEPKKRITMFSASDNSLSLRYQLNRVEAKLDLLLRQAGLALPVDPLDTEVKNLLRANQNIAAIRLVRQTTGMGLKDAKDWVEMIAKEV